MEKKYELTDEQINIGIHKLYRIRALRTFADVKAGDLGGYVESENNLAQGGDAWVGGSAKVFGNAWVTGNARVDGKACVCDYARVDDNAWVDGNNAWVDGDAEVDGNAQIHKNADWAMVSGFGCACRTTTFFRTKDGVGVVCGCFHGTLDEFRAKVRETYPDGKLGREYLMLADLMAYRFGEGGAEDDN